MRFTKSSSFYSVPVLEFNLPTGHTCPFAVKCKTVVDRKTGWQGYVRGRTFRCYAAAAERYPAVRATRWENYDALNACAGAPEMARAILSALPAEAQRIRIHASGDFFSQEYFDAWIFIAR